VDLGSLESNAGKKKNGAFPPWGGGRDNTATKGERCRDSGKKDALVNPVSGLKKERIGDFLSVRLFPKRKPHEQKKGGKSRQTMKEKGRWAA